MWQRIQTLYLAIATALVAVLFFSVKAVVLGPGETHLEEYKYIQFIPYLVLLIIIALLQILALTTYHVRFFQMRTAVLSGLLLIALQAWIAVDYFTADQSMVFRYTAIFPLVAAVLDFLAARSIFNDQMKVESANRLRSSRR